MPKKIKLSLSLFVFFSLLFHLSIFLAFYFFPALHSESQAQQKEAEKTRFEIFPIQLADIPKPKKEVKPQKARFVSQYNSSVKHETTAVQSKKKKSVDSAQNQRTQKASSPEKNKNQKPVIRLFLCLEEKW